MGAISIITPKSEAMMDVSYVVPIRKFIAPSLGAIMLAKAPPLCEATMRLIGRPELLELALPLRGAACSLAAELEAATWRSSDEARTAFPNARFTPDGFIVDLDDSHCVELTIIYEKGVAVVKFAGPSTGGKRPRAPMSGKRA
jgi:hypothetical protein